MTYRTGQVALVTGGSQGIGLGVVEALAGRGMMVAAMARSHEKLDRMMAELDPQLRGHVVAVAADVASEGDVQRGIADIIERFGRLDVLVNAAGISQNAFRRVEDTTTAEWRRLVDTNVTGTYLTCRQVLPHMRENGGYIINVLGGGAATYDVFAGSVLYTATKFAVRAITEGLIAEYADSNIRVSWVSPAQTATAIWNLKLDPPSDEIRAQMLQPSDVAEAFTWLLDRPEHTHVPGITINPWTGVRTHSYFGAPPAAQTNSTTER